MDSFAAGGDQHIRRAVHHIYNGMGSAAPQRYPSCSQMTPSKESRKFIFGHLTWGKMNTAIWNVAVTEDGHARSLCFGLLRGIPACPAALCTRQLFFSLVPFPAAFGRAERLHMVLTKIATSGEKLWIKNSFCQFVKVWKEPLHFQTPIFLSWRWYRGGGNWRHH